MVGSDPFYQINSSKIAYASPVINFIIPISGRLEQARRFFDVVRQQVVRKRTHNVHITLVYFETAKNPKLFDQVKSEFDALKSDSRMMRHKIEGEIIQNMGYQ